MHGLGGNFYSSSLNLRLADAMADLGIAVVCANNRGHDNVSSSPVNGRATTIGAAHEIVGDCKFDIGGWIDFLVKRRGHQRILLVGHSLGAIKILYATAHQPSEFICGVAGLSATRLCYQRFMESSGSELFQKWILRSEELVAAGRGDELMEVEFPFPTWITAASYRNKYGPEDRYDWLPLVDRILVPTLLLYGERELNDNSAFYGLWDDVTRATAGRSNFEIDIVKNADHFYSGVNRQTSDTLSGWIVKCFSLDG
jgi:pimeloyl-ACP methyl ester carboxylesterase